MITDMKKKERDLKSPLVADVSDNIPCNTQVLYRWDKRNFTFFPTICTGRLMQKILQIFFMRSFHDL